MAKKLYVGNLPYSTTSDDLQALFANGGTGTVISCQVIIDKMSGRSKGFGFVEMSTDEEAQATIAKWNGTDLEGRPLTVNEARPMEPRAPGAGNRSNGGGYGNKGNW